MLVLSETLAVGVRFYGLTIIKTEPGKNTNRERRKPRPS
jgi:hypothetical protein